MRGGEKGRGAYFLESSEGETGHVIGKSKWLRNSHYLESTEECMRTEESKLSRGTHILERVEGGKNEHMERKQVINGHSPTKECRGRDR